MNSNSKRGGIISRQMLTYPIRFLDCEMAHGYIVAVLLRIDEMSNITLVYTVYSLRRHFIYKGTGTLPTGH